MIDLGDCNMTELVSMTRMVDPHATRGYSRAVLIEIIETGEAPCLDKPRVDVARESIFKMVDHYWKQVESLINCPMQARTPRACFGCADIQVADCALANEELIRKVEGEEHE